MEDERIPRNAALTGALGVAPLIVSALLTWTPVAPRAFVAFAALAAGAVLLAFLAGTLAGPALTGQGRPARELLFSLPAMLAAFAAFMLPLHLGVALLIAGYFLIALWTVLSAEDGYLPLWRGKLMSLVCGAAIVALIAVLLRILFN